MSADTDTDMVFTGTYTTNRGRLILVFRDDDGNHWAEAPSGMAWIVPGVRGGSRWKSVSAQIVGKNFRDDTTKISVEEVPTRDVSIASSGWEEAVREVE